jgi:hypothetical protein
MKAALLASVPGVECTLPAKMWREAPEMGTKGLACTGWLQDVVQHAGTTAEKLLPYQVDDGAFFAVAKLKGPDIVRAAAMHNKREFQSQRTGPERFDRSLSYRNQVLFGPPAASEVVQSSKAKMVAAGICRLRKDAVRLIEVVLSVAPEYRINDVRYFSDSVSWLGSYFGGADNLLAADIHRDEDAPHCHILILPLLHGKMQGSSLIGSPGKFRAMQERFHKEVAAAHGFQRPPQRLNGATRRLMVDCVLQWFQSTPNSGFDSAAWPAIRKAIARDCRPFVRTLRITERIPESMDGHPPVLAAGLSVDKDDSTIDTAPAQVPTSDRTHCSVSFARSPATRPALDEDAKASWMLVGVGLNQDAAAVNDARPAVVLHATPPLAAAGLCLPIDRVHHRLPAPSKPLPSEKS